MMSNLKNKARRKLIRWNRITILTNFLGRSIVRVLMTSIRNLLLKVSRGKSY